MKNTFENNMAKKTTAIILAAGLGSRLKENTVDKPKCLVEVAEVPMLSRMLAGLMEIGISNVVIVVGYMKEHIISHVRAKFPELCVEFVVNSDYAKTGSVRSLEIGLERIQNQSVLIIEADVVIRSERIKALVAKSAADGNSCTILAPYRTDLSGTFALTEGALITSWDHESIRNNNYPLATSYKTVNITIVNTGADYQIFKNSVVDICAKGKNSPLEYAMQLSIDRGLSFGYLLASQNEWYEVDTPEDLTIANKMFAEEIQDYATLTE